MTKKWRVVFSELALKSLKKMDRNTASLILGFVEKKLEGCTDPRALGKALTAEHKGKWRYRIGDYRLLCLLDDDKVIVTVIAVGHRSDIYT